MKKELLGLFSFSMLLGASAGAQTYPVYYNNYLAPSQQQYYNPASQYSNQQQRTVAAQQGTKAETIKGVDSEKFKIRGQYGLDLGFEMGRKYTDFHFELATQSGDEHGSILTWTDMIFNEYKFTFNKSFKVANAPLFMFGEYKKGSLASSGKSYDDDLRVSPYYWISVGGLDASTSGYKFGIGWDKWFNVAGFQVSPVLGYTSQSHDLTMMNHKYPMPSVEIYLQQLNSDGVTASKTDTLYFIDEEGYATPSCLLSGQTIEGKTASSLPVGTYYYWNPKYDNGDGTEGAFVDASTMTDTTWTVGTNYDINTGCVIGGSYPFDLEGASQVYNVTWEGYFAGLMIDRYMTSQDSMHFYAEYSMLNYTGEGYWPFRNMRFTDEGTGNGLVLNMAYIHKFTPTLSFLIKAEYENYWLNSADTHFPADEEFAASTESDSMKEAIWQSMGLYLGLKATF